MKPAKLCAGLSPDVTKIKKMGRNFLMSDEIRHVFRSSGMKIRFEK
jgi:hypothetical protein